MAPSARVHVLETRPTGCVRARTWVRVRVHVSVIVSVHGYVCVRVRVHVSVIVSVHGRYGTCAHAVEIRVFGSVEFHGVYGGHQSHIILIYIETLPTPLNHQSHTILIYI